MPKTTVTEQFSTSSARDVMNLNGLLKDFYKSLPEHEKPSFDKLIFSATQNRQVDYKALAAENVLTEKELNTFASLNQSDTNIAPALFPSSVIVLKTTRLCNLRCTYCNAWREGPNNTMLFYVLAKTIRDTLQAPGTEHIDFVWHGGEPTLLGVKYYKKVLWLQNYFCPTGTTFSNALQTNAVNISDEMIDFIADHKISLGVSFDGPAEINDKRRLDTHSNPTSERIIKTLRRLDDKGITYGLLAVVDQEIASYPIDKLLDYFVLTGTKGLDLLNALPENNDDCKVIGTYLPFDEFVVFLCRVFPIWFENYRNHFDIRAFSALMDLLQDKPNGLCVFAGDCQGQYLTMESNGDVAACDKYVGHPDYIYSNLKTTDLAAGLRKSERLKRSQAELENYKRISSDCKWFSVCNGGCPHDRKLSKQYGKETKSCCGLSPLLDLIANTLSAQSYLS